MRQIPRFAAGQGPMARDKRTDFPPFQRGAIILAQQFVTASGADGMSWSLRKWRLARLVQNRPMLSSLVEFF